MNSGFYTSGAGMIARTLAMNPITENLTYANVAGYKRQEVIHRSFDDAFQEAVNALGNDAVASVTSGVELVQGVTDFSQGDMRHTGKGTDIAIDGDGFFSVDTGSGVYYTRNGTFQLGPEGYLLNQHGHQVLDSSGTAIQLNFNVTNIDRNFIVDDSGNISLYDDKANPTNIQKFGQIGITQFVNPQNLERLGGGLWANPGNAAGARDTSDAKVRQGYMELSNGNIVEGMMDMILNERIYETNAETLKRLDASLKNFIQTIGG